MKLHVPVFLYRMLLAALVATCSFTQQTAAESFSSKLSSFSGSAYEESDWSLILTGSAEDENPSILGMFQSSGDVRISVTDTLDISGNETEYNHWGMVYGTVYNTGCLTLEGDKTSIATLNDNRILGADYAAGGLFYNRKGEISIINHAKVDISGNHLASGMTSSNGSVLYDWQGSFTVSGNNEVTIARNTAGVHGPSNFVADQDYGVLFGVGSDFSFTNNGTVTFDSTCPIGDIILNGGTLDISGNKSFTMTASMGQYTGNDWLLGTNEAYAIYAATVSIQEKNEMGIEVKKTLEAEVSIKDNEKFAVSGYIDKAVVLLNAECDIQNNDLVSFKENVNQRWTGGILMGGEGEGSAIYLNTDNAEDRHTLTFSDNKTVEFIKNSVLGIIDPTLETSSYMPGCAYGAAIYSEGYKTIFKNNDKVVFDQNRVDVSCNGQGGALHALDFIYTGYSEELFRFQGNKEVSFTSNYAFGSSCTTAAYGEGEATGGAIYGMGGTYMFCDNGAVTFNGNNIWYLPTGNKPAHATYDPKIGGGAIWIEENMDHTTAGTITALNFENNGSVVFRGNYERQGDEYRLRSIYGKMGLYGKGVYVGLSSNSGQKISVYDSIYVEGNLWVNSKFDRPSLSYKGSTQGVVEISGEYVEADLMKIHNVSLDKLRSKYASEIENSRRNAAFYTHVAGGQFKLSNGVDFRGYAMETIANSGARITLSNSSLLMIENGCFIRTGTSMEIEGVTTVTGSLTTYEASTLTFNVSAVNQQTAALTIADYGSEVDGCLTLAAGVKLELKAAEELSSGKYILISVDSDDLVNSSSWTSSSKDLLGVSSKALSWVLEDDCYNLVWNVSSSLDPTPDNPEPEDPTPDNPPVGGDSLTWANAKKAVWQNGAGGWDGGEVFTNGADVSFGDGTVTIVGAVAPGEVMIAPTKSLTFKADKKNPGRISGDASVTIDAAPKAKVTMNDGNTYTGGTTIYDGMVKAGGVNSFGYGAITLNGGTLDLAGKAISNDIALEGAAIIKGGAKYTGDFSMGDDADLMKGSVVNVSAGKTVTLGGGVINGTLSGQGAVNVAGDVALGTTGKLTTSALAVESGTFSIGSKGLALSAKNSILTVNGGVVDSEGKLSTNELQMTGGSIRVESSKALSLDIKGKGITNYMGGGSITVAGKMNVTGDLVMYSDASIRLYDPSGSNKAMGLTVKGMLMTYNGGDITLNGALSAKDMYLNGGSITFNGSKHQTIKVGGVLMMEDGVDLNFNSGLQNGKSYKILTFKYSNLEDLSYSVDFYELLGLDKDACILTINKKDITMKVLDANALKGGENTASLAEGAPDAVTALVNPVLPDYSGVADALVQANWGLVESSRAFVNAIGNRSMAVQLGSGERAVWASAIAGSSRRSSSGTHGGADTNITGGAIGMETQLGENSLLGMALGNSWTRVSAHNYGTIKQDTTHLGIYGQTNWNKLSADWSAAYGRSESKFNGSDWSQRAIQLDGRLSYNHALSETVLLRGFGGVQYYASDSARVDGIDTGEVQNLRGEIGVGIVRSTYKSSVYAELALHQDLVRDNPEVTSPFGQRYHGTNPGRTGINFTIGGSYALSDQWSVNASYTAEVVENANAHSVNVGATYKF